jgi:hypothetical protein
MPQAFQREPIVPVQSVWLAHSECALSHLYELLHVNFFIEMCESRAINKPRIHKVGNNKLVGM